MKILFNIKLHQKALTLLEMIEKCGIHYNTSKTYLTKWDNCNWMDMFRLAYKREDLERQVEKYAAIKKRLIRSYIDVCDKINANTIDYFESKNKVTENY